MVTEVASVVGTVVNIVAMLVGMRWVGVWLSVGGVVLLSVGIFLSRRWGEPLGWRELVAAVSAPTAVLLPGLIWVLLPPPPPLVAISAQSDTQPVIACTNYSSDGYCKFVVEGTSKHVQTTDGDHLYLLVHPLGSSNDDWYLQGRPAHVGTDGVWTIDAQAGTEAWPVRNGDQFTLMAMLTGPDAKCTTSSCRGKPIDDPALLTLPFHGNQDFSDVKALTVSEPRRAVLKTRPETGGPAAEPGRSSG